LTSPSFSALRTVESFLIIPEDKSHSQNRTFKCQMKARSHNLTAKIHRLARLLWHNG
jgi:hypothetical protein